MSLLENISDFLFEGDLQEHYLVKYPSISISTVVLYVVFAKWLGPWIMRDRKPYDLKHIMIVYNFMQCFFNAYTFYKLLRFSNEYWSNRCMAKYNPLHNTAIEEIKRTGWLMYLIKYSDLLDTVFFVLRKKNNQVTFLHIFHHAAMCLLCLWYIRSTQNIGYYLCVGLTINNFVHVVMYFYYGLSAFGPKMQKYLWWKQYLTQIQIAQFFAVMLYMLHGFVTGCEDLGLMEIIGFLYVAAVCVLFLDFYNKDRKKREQKTSRKGLYSKDDYQALKKSD